MNRKRKGRKHRLIRPVTTMLSHLYYSESGRKQEALNKLLKMTGFKLVGDTHKLELVKNKSK